MKIPLRVTFRNLSSSPELEARIGEKMESLERICDDLIGCRVLIEEQHRHHHKGRLIHVRIELSVPGSEIIVSRDPAADHAHEDPFVAVRDAFEALERQLDVYLRRRRGETKAHVTEQPSGAEA